MSKPFDYKANRYGRACLKEAAKSKGSMKFGSVLVKDGRIIGRGWNRLSTKEERAVLSHVDYAIHAEQASIYDALQKGIDPTGAICYVLGESNAPKTRGKLSIRDGRYFTCKKCPHAMKKYGVKVRIPHTDGWETLSAEEALESAKSHQGYWSNFVAA